MKESAKAIPVGARVRVTLAREIEGFVRRVGLTSATVEVDTDLGPLIISAPFDSIEIVPDLETKVG